MHHLERRLVARNNPEELVGVQNALQPIVQEIVILFGLWYDVTPHQLQLGPHVMFPDVGRHFRRAVPFS